MLLSLKNTSDNYFAARYFFVSVLVSVSGRVTSFEQQLSGFLALAGYDVFSPV